MISLTGTIRETMRFPHMEGERPQTQIVAMIDEVKGIDSPGTIRMIKSPGGYAFVVPAVFEENMAGKKFTYEHRNGNGDGPSFCLEIEGMFRYRGKL